MFQLILCTCPDIESAKVLAKHLVTNKYAACVNILPNITSVYLWQDKVECDNEVQLFIKTTAEKFALVRDEIKRVHSYDTPEIIAMNIQQGDNDYLNWITESLK